MNRRHFIYQACSAIFCVSVGDPMDSVTVGLAISAKIPPGRVCQGAVKAGGSMREVSRQLRVMARPAGQGHHGGGTWSRSSQIRGAEHDRSWEPGSDTAAGWPGRDVGTKVGVWVNEEVAPRPHPTSPPPCSRAIPHLPHPDPRRGKRYA